MSPSHAWPPLPGTGFPRVSGDEPPADLQAEEMLLFSPRERG